MATSIENRRKEFDTIDADGNGIISFREWYTYFEDKTEVTKGMTKAEIRILFRVYDTQGEEKGIDFEEYCVFMQEILDPIRNKSRRKEFDTIDTDGNGLISFEEWYAYFKSKREVTRRMSKAEIRIMFQVYDTQGEEEGIDFKEYCVFMEEVLDPIRSKKAN